MSRVMDESKLPLNWLQGITGGASGGGDQQQQNGGTSVEALWALRQGPTIFILKNVMYCSDVECRSGSAVWEISWILISKVF